jgi:hypothetical protein
VPTRCGAGRLRQVGAAQRRPIRFGGFPRWPGAAPKSRPFVSCCRAATPRTMIAEQLPGKSRCAVARVIFRLGIPDAGGDAGELVRADAPFDRRRRPRHRQSLGGTSERPSAPRTVSPRPNIPRAILSRPRPAIPRLACAPVLLVDLPPRGCCGPWAAITPHAVLQRTAGEGLIQRIEAASLARRLELMSVNKTDRAGITSSVSGVVAPKIPSSIENSAKTS